MGNPYTSVTVDSYNANPPTDNGVASANNKIEWAKIKTKVGDPCVAAINGINTNVGAAFGKVVGLGAIVSSATDVTATVDDQGQTFVFTAAATFTLPEATVVGSPFAVAVRNRSTGTLTIAAPVTTPVQHVSGVASVALGPDDGGMIVCDGSNFEYIGTQASKSFATGTKCLFFQTAAPLGWTKDTSLDDAGIKLVSGAATDGGSVAFSSMFSQLTLAAGNIPQLTGNTGDDTPDHTHDSRTGGAASADVGGTTRLASGGNPTGGASNRHHHPVTLGNASPVPLDFRIKFAAAIRAVKN